jgi:hypothetical protein
MFDKGFLEQILVNLALAGRVEDFLLDLGVDRQLEANLGNERLLAPFPTGFFELGEEVLDRAVILLKQRHCIFCFCFRHLSLLLRAWLLNEVAWRQFLRRTFSRRISALSINDVLGRLG